MYPGRDRSRSAPQTRCTVSSTRQPGSDGSEVGLLMYDLCVFFGFVAIVLSPCVVARFARADREERGGRRPLPLPVPSSTQPRKPKRPLILDPVRRKAAVPSARTSGLHTPFPPRASRTRQAASALFISPIRRDAATRPEHARRLRKSPAAFSPSRRSGSSSIFIAPVRREAAVRPRIRRLQALMPAALGYLPGARAVFTGPPRRASGRI